MDRAPPPTTRFHPKLAKRYRELIGQLHVALDNADARSEAVEILRTLITDISVNTSGDADTTVILTGDIVKLLVLPGGQVPASFESSVKVVAGARNSFHSTFRASGFLRDASWRNARDANVLSGNRTEQLITQGQAAHM